MKPLPSYLLLALALALGGWLGSATFTLPAPVDADAPAERFSAGRAARHLDAIAVTPRPLEAAEARPC